MYVKLTLFISNMFNYNKLLHVNIYKKNNVSPANKTMRLHSRLSFRFFVYSAEKSYTDVRNMNQFEFRCIIHATTTTTHKN